MDYYCTPCNKLLTYKKNNSIGLRNTTEFGKNIRVLTVRSKNTTEFGKARNKGLNT